MGIREFTWEVSDFAQERRRSILSVTEAVRALHQGTLSAAALLDACAANIDATNHEVQAWESWMWPQARAQAERLGQGDDALAHGHDARRCQDALLWGVPFGAKDNYFTRGHVTSGSSARFAHFVPTYNASALEALYAHGAVLVGKNTSTEMAIGNPPPTRNPWNIAHTPGGSSTGSAAAVAAGHVPFSLGTQTGGSLNRPASYCGLVVLKPTWGRISTLGVFPLAWSLDHIGALTRTLTDQALVFDALCGTQMRARLRTPAGLVGVTIGRPDRYFLDAHLHAAQRKAYEQTLQTLARKGAKIKEVKLPQVFESAVKAHAVIMNFEIARAHTPTQTADWNLMRPMLRSRLRSGNQTSASAYLRAQALRRSYTHAMAALYEDIDVLLTPTTPTPADHGIADSGSSRFNTPFSLCGFPTLVLPSGIETRTNLPLSVQLVAPPHQESRLFDIATYFA